MYNNNTEEVNYKEIVTKDSLFSFNFNSEEKWKFVQYFFDKSVTKGINSEDLKKLAEIISKESWYKFTDKTGLLSEQNLENSETHKTFLKIIENYFGKDAYKFLEERKNLSIFNLKEIHVLNQKIFDNLGEDFVNNVINYELDGSLVTIPKLLSDDTEMQTFKFYYSLYKEVVGTNSEHMTGLFLKYDKYKELFSDLKKNYFSTNHVSSEYKNILKEVLSKKVLKKDKESEFFPTFKNINNEEFEIPLTSVKDLDDFYNSKNQKYNIDKQIALNESNLSLLGNAILKNFFALNINNDDHYNNNYSPSNTSVKSLLYNFDIDTLINEKGYLNDDEKEILKDLKTIDFLSFPPEKDNPYENTPLEDKMNILLKLAEKYESKGNKIPAFIFSLKDKISSVFIDDMINSITTTSMLEEKVNAGEQGISKEEHSHFIEYTLNGTDFAFIVSTNFLNGSGLSGYGRNIKNIADSWFTYENGTSHISSSYINQDKLCAIEFNKTHDGKGDKLTFIFDHPKISSMDSKDVYSSLGDTRNTEANPMTTNFTFAKKIIENTKELSNRDFHNEILLYRYNLNSNKIRFGGKVIPSGIIVNGKIEEYHKIAAEQLTKFLIDNKLKPEGYKIPIIVVNKEKYIELQIAKRNEEIKKIINLSSEPLYENAQEAKQSQETNIATIQKGTR